jgi:hypothetical protein
MVDEDDDPLLGSLPPPRLFCDICDVFDQHDTDDCPMQTMSPSDSPPHTMHHGGKAPGGSDRPYCENCEGRGRGRRRGSKIPQGIIYERVWSVLRNHIPYS